MKKLLLPLLLIACTEIAAQSYAEGADLPGTGTGPNFTMMGPVMTISGTLNTPGDGQDRFQITVPVGCQITGASWSITDTANINVNGFAQFGWANQENIPPLNGTFANGPFAPFPCPPGTYDCMMNANIAANDSWSMTFYSDCPLGIVAMNSTEEIEVMPNPATDQISFVGDNVQGQLIVVDALGQTVITDQLSPTRGSVSVADLSDGVYYYTLISEGDIRRGQIIIAR